jgi:hypothetical protein
MRAKRPPDCRPSRPASEASNCRAVSDVPAFILMFSIIVLSVTTIAVAGVDQLTALNERERIQTAERAMEANAASLDKIHQQSDPFRSLQFPVSGGSLWLNQTTLSVDSTNMDLSGTPFASPIDVNALEHRFERSPADISIVYEAGGAFRSGAGIERYEPAFRCTSGAGGSDTVAVVSVVNLTSDDSIDFAADFRREFSIDPLDIPGSGANTDLDRALRIDAELVGTNRTVDATNPGTITVDVSETAYPDQWVRYLRVAEGWTQQGSGFEFECDADRALLRVVTVELSTPGV